LTTIVLDDEHDYRIDERTNGLIEEEDRKMPRDISVLRHWRPEPPTA
jgi:hypothetical protein